MAETSNSLKNYKDQSRKPSFRKGKVRKKIIYPKWWTGGKK